MNSEAEQTRPAVNEEDPAVTQDSYPDDVLSNQPLENILEALLLVSDMPLSLERLQNVVEYGHRFDRRAFRRALARLESRYADTACELQEVAGGWRLQVRSEYSPWIVCLQQERPSKMSRAMLEILAIIVYRQPVTRGEIEEIRGVTVSTNVLRSLLERGWVRELGHKETPGRPILYGSTRQFLDDLNLDSLSRLPELPEVKDMNQLEAAISRLSLTKTSASGESLASADGSLQDQARKRMGGAES